MPASWSPADLAPGALLALAALAAAVALRRGFGAAVPRRAWAAFAVAVALLLGPALAGGRVLAPLDLLLRTAPYGELDLTRPVVNAAQADVVREIVPWQAQVREAMTAGRWPLWNRRLAAGMPLWSNPQAQALAPLVRLADPLPLPAALGAIAGLRLLVALVFTFLLLRRLGRGETAAAAGGLAYGLSGAMLQWLGWAHANSLALLPGLLWAVMRVDESGRRRDVALLAGVLTASLLAGHPETLLFNFLVTAAFAGARLARRRRGERLRRVGRWAAAAVVAGALSAPLLLPTLAYLPQTVRSRVVDTRLEGIRQAGPWAGWRSPEERGRSLRAMAARLVSPAAPFAFGASRLERYWGPWTSHMDTAGFAGTAALLAALLAFAPGREARRFAGERFARWGAVAVLATAVAQPPGFAWTLSWLPVLNRSGSMLLRAGVLLPLFVALLASATWERWRRGELARSRVVVAAAALAALVLWAYLAHPPPAAISGVLGAAGDGRLTALRAGALALQLAVLALAAVLLAWRRRPAPGAVAAAVAAGGRRRGRRAAALLVAAVALEPIVLFAAANPSQPKALFYPETAVTRFLRRHLDDGARFVGEGIVFPPNTASMHGLDDVRTYDPMRPAAHLDLTAPVSAPAPEAIFRADHLTSPLYDLLGARYAVTRPRNRLAGRAPVFRGEHCWVHERPGALPPLFLPASARVFRGGDWAAEVAAIEDFAAAALVQAAPGRDRDWRARWPQAVRWRFAYPEPERFSGEAWLAEPRLLASSVYQDGGWRLLVDRRPAPTVLADGVFAAAWLPPGAPRVELIYRPPGWVAGWLLAALGLAAGIAGLARPRRPAAAPGAHR